ncbi:MAG: 3-phosphoshikimate 1-carboxyvinyltransferase [Gemmatimonadetes bacterium]|nr:3-phosphoshikimate 1-carboxyvinyltransferase [Gemmatimonadota bacterium]
MNRVGLGPVGRVRSRVRVPGDKSISHRALVLNAVAEGTATVRGLAPGADVGATLGALEALGVTIERLGDDRVRVTGGAHWHAKQPIDCQNSGTTARLLLGLLASRAPAPVTLTGDQSLSRRPMRRVVEPLRRMGAEIEPADTLPLTVTGRPLTGAEHHLDVASAQLKTALLLAGLAADGLTMLIEPGVSRDHTERVLAAMGARIERREREVRVRPGDLTALDIDVPGDFSSAAPFLALAAAREGSEIVVEEVGLNPTRTGFLDLLRAFGAEVETTVVVTEPEPYGDVRVMGTKLSGIDVDPEIVPRTIDELPLIAVVATQAEGLTRVRGATELRVKESDRIEAIAAGLVRMGADMEMAPDGFDIRGPTVLEGARLDAAGDHRIGMALAIGAALAQGGSTLDGTEWIDVSYPSFLTDLVSCAGVPVRV